MYNQYLYSSIFRRQNNLENSVLLLSRTKVMRKLMCITICFFLWTKQPFLFSLTREKKELTVFLLFQFSLLWRCVCHENSNCCARLLRWKFLKWNRAEIKRKPFWIQMWSYMKIPDANAINNIELLHKWFSHQRATSHRQAFFKTMLLQSLHVAQNPLDNSCHITLCLKTFRKNFDV